MRFAKHLAKLAVIFTALGPGIDATAGTDDVVIQAVADARETSPKEDLRLALFKDPKTPACLLLKGDPRGRTEADASLTRFLTELIAALKKKDDKELQPLFHPRLNVSLASLSEILARMENTYGAPLDVSVYRLWALNTVDGTPRGLSCPDDRLQVYPQYGYPLQFGVWLQVLGPKELGRIYVSIVPAEGRWNIGGFHVQQWTHTAKDAAAWAADAEKAHAKGLTEAAFVKYDLAAKLADGGKLLELAERAELERRRDAVQSRSAWDLAVQDAVKPAKPIYTGTMLVMDGAGILIRQKIDGEISVEDIKKDCRTLAQQLLQKPWSAELIGVRCGYNLPREDPKTDGILGGIFIPFAELKKL